MQRHGGFRQAQSVLLTRLDDATRQIDRVELRDCSDAIGFLSDLYAQHALARLTIRIVGLNFARARKLSRSDGFDEHWPTALRTKTAVLFLMRAPTLG